MLRDARPSLIMDTTFRRIRSRLLKSAAAARMASFSTCDSLGGVMTRGVLGSMGTLFTVGPCGPKGPPVTGGPLLRPLTVFNSFKVAVSCLLAEVHADSLGTAMMLGYNENS